MNPWSSQQKQFSITLHTFAILTEERNTVPNYATVRNNATISLNLFIEESTIHGHFELSSVNELKLCLYLHLVCLTTLPVTHPT
jgi:hypothetical protein